MPRSYQHINIYENEITELSKQGKSRILYVLWTTER
jgi:hypothetical protein